MSTNQKPEQTAVIFRTFITDGDVIALFPFEPSDIHGHHCNSYQRIGQHAGATPDLMRGNYTRPSTPEEIAPLRDELIRIGYTLREMKRFPSNAFRIRVNAVEKTRHKAGVVLQPADLNAIYQDRS